MGTVLRLMDGISDPRQGSGEWLRGAGLPSDAEREILARDWSSNPLGDLGSWPEHLRLATRVMLNSQFPMMIVWGPDLIQLYNDAFRPILGRDKHPGAFGDNARNTWSEIWDEIGPLFASVLDDGQAVWAVDQRLIIERNGYPEETFFTYSYSPVHDDTGAVAGLLVVATETTSQVVDRRRLAAIGSLATALVSATTIESVADATVRSLAGTPSVPTIEIHLLVGEEVIRVASPRQPLTDAADRDLLRETGSAPAPIVLDPDWTPGIPARRAAFGIDDPTVRTVVVAQLNEHRPFDDDYQQFLVLIRQLIAASMTAALRRAAEVGELRLIADTLQHAMLELASDLPTVAARYRPAAANMAVGGDWYEVVDLGAGRRSLIVGDCVGHGLEAATAMGALRNVSRAVLSDGQGPAEVLSSLHRFAKTTPAALGATVVCAVVDLHARTVTYANGGHPPPLLVRKSHAIWLGEALGPPLAVGDPDRREAEVTLDAGDVLILYTDGLIERRGEVIDVGLQRLRESALTHRDESVQSLADHLIADLIPDAASDDVALVVKRVHQPTH